MEEILMIDPPPRSIIFGTVSRTRRSAALTLISIILSSISSVTSSAGPFPILVALLLTRISTGPRRDSVSQTIFCNCSRRPTWHSIGTTLPGSVESSLAVASRFCILRLAITTFAPASAKCRAIALPMPRPPPVTIATLPCNEIETLMEFYSRLRSVMFFQFEFGDRLQVHFVGSVGQSQRARHRPRGSETKIGTHAGPTVRLDRSIDDPQRHVRRYDLDHGDFGSRLFVADRVHELRGLEREQSGLFNLDPRMGNVGANRPLLREWFAECHARQNPFARGFQRPLGQANQAHAVMNPSWSKPTLRDFESAAFAQQDVRHRHADIFKQDFGMSMRRVVIAKNGQHPPDCDARRIHGHQDHRLSLVHCRCRV